MAARVRDLTISVDAEGNDQRNAMATRRTSFFAQLIPVLFKWLAFSLLIPSLGIFIRWLYSFARFGPDYISLFSLLPEPEVPFLAAMILAETLGEAPDVGQDGASTNALSWAQGGLLAFLVLSLLVFGALFPLSTSDTSWLSRQGRGFHAQLNATLLVLSILTCLAARLIYHRISRLHPGEGARGTSNPEVKRSQAAQEEEHE